MRNVKITFVLIVLLQFMHVYAFGQQAETMTVHYIDVGQGQAMLLEFPKGAVLIDAGSQKDMEGNVVAYLNQFFTRRADLNRTLNTVFVTHQHIDHDYALKDVATHFKVVNYIDNGNHDPHGSGKNQLWLQQNATGLGIHYEAVTFDKVSQGGNLKGMTDNFIAPFGTSPDDPKIVLYSGAFSRNDVAVWSDTDYNDENNHSLLIKVSFGKASFLFMGDLAIPGIAKVLQYYQQAPGLLHADVLQVGHHGAAKSTTGEWVKAVAPHYAVISCGHWDYGVKLPDSTATTLTTYAYGHPNKVAIQFLENEIPDRRPVQIKEHIGIKGTAKATVKPRFEIETITGNIYATAWNGTINIKATTDGVYTVTQDRDH